jgi:transposase-like protein
MAEDDGSKPRGLDESAKALCRRDYEVGGAKIAPLARKYGIARNTLKAWIEKEAWSRTDQAIDQMVSDQTPDSDVLRAAAKSNVLDFVKRRARELASENGAIETIASTEISNVQRMAAIESVLLEVAEQTAKRLRGDEGTTPLRQSAMASEAADIKAAVEAIGKTIDLYAKLHGASTGQSILDDEQVDNDFTFTHTVYEASRADAV